MNPMTDVNVPIIPTIRLNNKNAVTRSCLIDKINRYTVNIKNSNKSTNQNDVQNEKTDGDALSCTLFRESVM